LADLVKALLGAKLIEGVISEIAGENEETEQAYSSNNNSSQEGSMGYQYYIIGQKSCKEGKYKEALKWFKESQHLEYEHAKRAIDSANVKCVNNNTYASNKEKMCSSGELPTHYVDNKCPNRGNKWSKNNTEISSDAIESAFDSHRDGGSYKEILGKSITIKAPKYVENAAVVPVTVAFGDRVESGDKIKLYVNGELALQVNPKKGSYIDQISTRVILERKSSRIKAKIIRLSGVIETKTSNKISADNSASIPSSSDSSKKHKLREKDGNIKMLLKNKMGSGKHIWKIKLVSSSGEVFVKLSPLLSKNPYLQIKGNHGNAKLVKTFYGNCSENYSEYSISEYRGKKEPTCLFEQERWYAALNKDKKPLNISENGSSSFSDLWGQYGGSLLDSNTSSSSNKGDSYNVSDADTQPPVIRFNHSDSILVNDKRATISGVIKDSSKITGLLIKGKEVAIDENGNFSMSRYVRLGRNTFDIVALDAFGNKATKVVTVTRKKDIAKNLDKPLDLPSFKGRKDKNAVALIIGLDKYESIARAPWAESDASVFFDYAQQSLGIPADRIALITGDKSDRSGIYDSLDMWLPTMVEKGDSNVYVYFAGHGLATADGEQAYLIPYDGNLDNLRRTAIPRKEVISVLKDLKAKSVTLFMDTCYSGTPKGGKGTLVADSRGLRIVKKDNFSSLPKNFTIFSAASNQQTASSHPSLENGLFSYWMMRGLGGEADNNNDRKITNGELHKFINKNVKKAAALMGRKQNSQLVGDANKVIASW